jgi:hypothetical protein
MNDYIILLYDRKFIQKNIISTIIDDVNIWFMFHIGSYRATRTHSVHVMMSMLRQVVMIQTSGIHP